MKIDRDTHDDVVQLIQEEMEAGNFLGTGRSEVPERLASLIEGRLCIETPKKSCLPEITQGDWMAEKEDDGQYWKVVSPIPLFDDPCTVVAWHIFSDANAKLLCAAPELAQWMYEYAVGNMLSSGSPTVEPMTSLIRLLQKAGVDL